MLDPDERTKRAKALRESLCHFQLKARQDWRAIAFTRLREAFPDSVDVVNQAEVECEHGLAALAAMACGREKEYQEELKERGRI